MIVPNLDMLANVRVNQWVAHLPEDHPLVQQHRTWLGATAPITWTSSFNRHLAACNGLRLPLARGYDSLHHIKVDDLKRLRSMVEGDGCARYRTLLSDRKIIASDQPNATMCPTPTSPGQSVPTQDL